MFRRARIPLVAMATEGMLPGRARRQLYRRRGYRVASDVEFAPGVVIDGEDVEIAPGAKFGLGTVIRGRRIRIGRRAVIGSFCIFEGRDIEVGDDTVVREQVFVGGPLLPDSLLEIGKRVRVFQTCFLNPSRPLHIGDDTGVGGRSSIFTHGSWQSALEGYPVAFQPVTIGRNVWLPWHVFILPGVEIGDDATIGAGAVINRSIPAGSLAAGVPAKVLKGPDEWPRRLDEEEQWGLAIGIFTEFLGYLADNGVKVARGGETGGRRDATLTYGSLTHRITLVADAATARPEDELLLAVRGVPKRDGSGSPWFALLARQKGGAADDISHETEDFLARYGMRFVPIDELPPA